MISFFRFMITRSKRKLSLKVVDLSDRAETIAECSATKKRKTRVAKITANLSMHHFNRNTPFLNSNRLESNPFHSMKTKELSLFEVGHRYVCGCDEAGRGPLCGPVVACCAFIPPYVLIDGVRDSKKIAEEEREKLFELLTTHPDIKYAVHVNSHERIDEINILQASLESMKLCIQSMPFKVDYCLIDGNKLPFLENVKMEAIVKGDSLCYVWFFIF